MMRIFSISLALFIIFGLLLQAQPVQFPNHHYQNINRIEILPSGTVSMAANSTLRFTVVAYNHQNMVFTPNFVTWEASGGNISSDGTYTSGNYTGTFQITARCHNVRSMVNVQVHGYGQSISRVVINPENISLSTNGTMQFSAVAYDVRNRPVSGSFTWSATGGYIDQNGLYRAGYTGGNYTVTAREVSTGMYGTAVVRVTSGYYPPNPPHPNPNPFPSNARIVITDFDIGGNFLNPKIKVTAQVYGQRIQTVKILAVKQYGVEEIDAQSCQNGDTVRLEGKFDRFATKYIHIKLYDNFGREVASETRNSN